MKRVLLIVAVGFIFLSTGYVFRTEVAEVVWRVSRADKVVYALDPTAERAFALGKHYFSLGENSEYDLTKASNYFKEAVRLDQILSGPRYELGRIYFLDGRFQNAIEEFDKQLELPRDAYFKDAHYMKGLTYGYMKQFPEAEKEFQFIIDETKREGEVPLWAYYVDLGWVYFSQGQFRELGRVSMEAVEHYPNNPWVLSNLGLALMNRDHDDEAVGVFEVALEEAKKLTERHWRSAYPGNDPRLAGQGLGEMIEAIEANLARAVDKRSQASGDSV